MYTPEPAAEIRKARLIGSFKTEKNKHLSIKGGKKMEEAGFWQTERQKK